MKACRAVTNFALYIGKMGCLFYTHESTGLAISSGVAGKTLLIMLPCSHFKYPKVPGALESTICLYE
jgi:hypothetical protein